MGISKGKIKQENIDLFAWISGGSFIFLLALGGYGLIQALEVLK
jgi:hypothetical protein